MKKYLMNLIIVKDFYEHIKHRIPQNCKIYLSSGHSCAISTARTIILTQYQKCIIIDIFNSQREYEMLTEILKVTVPNDTWIYLDYRDDQLNEKISSMQT